MRTPILRWLSFRLRIVLGLTLVVSSLLPPYVPSSALSADDNEVVPSQQFLFVEDGFLMKASSVGTQGSRLAFSDVLVYKVKDGETLDQIAKRFGISPQTIKWSSGLDSNTVKPGQDLVILPVDGVIHTVQRGQTLGRIAQLYDIPADAITRQNKLKGGFITAGQQIIVPGGKPVAGASTIAAATDALKFASTLPNRNIQLFDDPKTGGKTTTTAKPRGPLAGAVVTSSVLQSPCGAGCSITQGYSPSHYALDMQIRGGAPIYAAADGVVIRADTGWNGGYGNVIEIDHGNGLVTLYGHNKELYVKKGDKVTRGQQISFMGNTGRVHGPTGIHVHFEVRVNGVKKNPLLYLE
jgi:murein DD-endopeptidase MepM/ murein hydrolase activator NlpD